MKNKLSWLLLSSVCCFFMSCSSSSTKAEELEKEEEKVEEIGDFYKGADISWITEMESKGHKFYNNNGQERECTALMKE